MAEGKIFAGHKVRRLRNRLGLTQTEMAGEIDISPSYLNLIERNQRPLTVQVLLKLTQAYNVPVSELAGEDRDGAQALRQIFSDPLLAAEMPGPQEIIEVADTAPNFARAVARLHEAYRGALERLSDLSSEIARDGEGHSAPTLLPFERVVRTLEGAGPFFPPIEERAEEIAARLKPREEPFGALKGELAVSHGVETRVLPTSVLSDEAGRFDRHSMRLFISEKLPGPERALVIAHQLCLMAGSDAMHAVLDALGVEDAEARRIGRILLARRMAEAVLVPLERLETAHAEFGLDVLSLADRFAVPPIVVLRRLCVLGAKGGNAPGFSLIEVDRAGIVIGRQLSSGFPFPRFGALCARWPLFDAPSPPGVSESGFEMPDGTRFATLTLRHESRVGPEPVARTAMLAWRDDEVGHARPAGLTCRLCERAACPQRSHPPVNKPSALQDYVIGFAPFDLP